MEAAAKAASAVHWAEMVAAEVAMEEVVLPVAGLPDRRDTDRLLCTRSCRVPRLGRSGSIDCI